MMFLFKVGRTLTKGNMDGRLCAPASTYGDLADVGILGLLTVVAVPMAMET